MLDSLTTAQQIFGGLAVLLALWQILIELQILSILRSGRNIETHPILPLLGAVLFCVLAFIL